MANGKKAPEESSGKVMTKYDLKMQRRAEEKKRAEREKQLETAGCIVIVILVAALVLSFPIRNYLAVNGAFLEIDGKKVTRPEYEYNFNMLVNNYVNSIGSTYLSYMGLDLTQDLSTQMYSSTMTWKDYFDQMTVDSMKEDAALMKEAEQKGFTHDVTAEYETYVANLKETAAAQGMSDKEYVKQGYGMYATPDRIEPFVKKSLFITAYYEQLMKENAASDEAVQKYYEENRASYDSVDFYVMTIEAELPAEPTELADETSAGWSADSGEVYSPSEAEIALAMEKAKAVADEAVASVETVGDFQENVTQAGASYWYSDWLFDDDRRDGDTTVIENSISQCYYVLSFDRRYLDETVTANARVILVPTAAEMNGEAILNAWRGGEATEESYIALCTQYSQDSTASEGGLCEGITNSRMYSEAMRDWLFAGERKAGDATCVSEDGYDYVLYYTGAGKPEWQLSIADTLLNQALSEHLESIKSGISVADPKGNLNYLKVLAAQETPAAE